MELEPESKGFAIQPFVVGVTYTIDKIAHAQLIGNQIEEAKDQSTMESMSGTIDPDHLRAVRRSAIYAMSSSRPYITHEPQQATRRAE